MLKNSVKIAISLMIVVILLLVWAPWLTEEDGKEKVLDYFNQSYGVDKNDIRVGSVEKKPFEIDFGLYLSPSNKSLPETSIRARINFYGNVKHEILSAPWFTEENAKERVIDYFSQKYGIDKNDIRIDSIEKKPFEMHFGLGFELNESSVLTERCIVHAWVTIYGEVKHELMKCVWH